MDYNLKMSSHILQVLMQDQCGFTINLKKGVYNHYKNKSRNISKQTNYLLPRLQKMIKNYPISGLSQSF